MGFIILHLSDLHIKSNQRFDDKIVPGIVQVVESEYRDRDAPFILAITGDLCYSGSLDDAIAGSDFIDELVKQLELKGMNPRLLLVPGNHDINISEDFTSESIRKWLTAASKEACFIEQLNNMDPFFLVASEYSLFTESRSVHQEIFELPGGSRKLECCLLNTAPFSTRYEDNKQLHYADSSMVDGIRKAAADNVKIVLMHHSAEWFCDDSKRRLENELQKNCDILLLGHEHENKAEINDINHANLILLRGGTIDTEGYGEGTFSIYKVDPSANALRRCYYRWNRQSCVFVCTHKDDSFFATKNPEAVGPHKAFAEKITRSVDANNLPLSDIFTFPGVKREFQPEQSDDSLLSSIEELWDVVRKVRIVNLVGASRSGKTSLLRALYGISFEAGFSPLYLDHENSTPSVTKLLSDLISEQYGENDLSRSRFHQCRKDQKVLLIDDFDKLKVKSKRDEYLDSLLCEVGHIVISTSDSLDGGIIDQVKASLGIEDKIEVYRIRDFYKQKRDDLIERVCKAKGLANQSDAICKVIDRAVHGHQRLYRLTPDFIIQSILFYLDKGTSDHAEEAPFSVIFESNITNKLFAALKKKRGVHFVASVEASIISQTLTLLALVAYQMHHKKIEHISLEDFKCIVDDYIERCGLSVTFLQVLDLGRDAGIIEAYASTSDIRFASVNYHAFFVARWLHSLANRHEDISYDISYLLNNVCFEVNEHILLFLSYFRGDPDFAYGLLSALEDAIGDEEEIDFDAGNIGFLTTGICADVPMATEQTKKRRDEVIAQKEEAAQNEMIYSGPYDYDEKESNLRFNRITRALKYLEMLGKSLIGQYAITTKEEKEKVARALGSYTNRVLYAALEPLNECFDKVVDTLYEQLQDEGGTNAVTKSGIKDVFAKMALSLCLGTYDVVAYSCSNYETVTLISSVLGDTTNARIQMLIACENGAESTVFQETAITMFRDAKKKSNFFEMLSIQAIVNKHLMEHKSIPFNQLQRLNDVIFSGAGNYRRMNRSRG